MAAELALQLQHVLAAAYYMTKQDMDMDQACIAIMETAVKASNADRGALFASVCVCVCVGSGPTSEANGRADIESRQSISSESNNSQTTAVFLHLTSPKGSPYAHVVWSARPSTRARLLPAV